MKKKILVFLYFSRSESRAAWMLIILGFGLLLLPNWIKQHWPRVGTNIEPEWKITLEEHFIQKASIQEAGDTLRPIPFDPNKVSLDSLLEMGLPAKVAHTLVNYREKGGYFRKKEDLKKIYGLDSLLYAGLSNYIQLEKQITRRERPEPVVRKKKTQFPSSVQIDVNQADQEEWKQLFGIGPVLSGRIVKFREALGGFAHIDQVGETYGLADSVFQSIRPQLVWSPPFRQIDINHCSLEELAGHPYISWKLARRILLYRGQHGFFQDWEDFEKMREVPKKVRKKIKPYLSF